MQAAPVSGSVQRGSSFDTPSFDAVDLDGFGVAAEVLFGFAVALLALLLGSGASARR